VLHSRYSSKLESASVGLLSIFGGSKANKGKEQKPSAVQPSAEKGGGQLRSLASMASNLPADDAKKLMGGLFAVSVASFEESYQQALSGRPSDPNFRDAFLFRTLIGDLVDRTYIGFLAMHALTYANRLQSLTWSARTQAEVEQVGEMASLFLVHPHYQLTPDQQARERAILAERSYQSGPGGVATIIKAAKWEVARVVLCEAMDTLSRNIMEVWAGAEAHEQLVYQTFMLCLRTDNCLGALLLHQWAMAHHQRGWDWRPSPDEFHAVAENLARQLVDERRKLAALIH
jgi:hypothetical protein